MPLNNYVRIPTNCEDQALKDWATGFVNHWQSVSTRQLVQLGENYLDRCIAELKNNDDEKKQGMVMHLQEKQNAGALLYPSHFFEELLFAGIFALRFDVIQAVLEHQYVNAELLNKRQQSFSEKPKVSFLRAICVKSVSGKSQLKAKIAIVDALLDAGASNVQLGYKSCGIVGYTPMQALCDRNLWPGIVPGTHRRLLKRFRALGARPHFQWEPVLDTPYEIATRTAPYLLDLLPDNEDDNGQMTLEPVPVLRERRWQNISQQIGASSFLI